ncbi:uncharacterized protein IUM83_15706 [Phytophthora cinnamomi]|uniref:uncharacterized protein n=1 Tax=Phytophthora cinnamomi TaxID=4785 RepID=UPI003559CBA5|nr:hypothetical protein IUM83_15706 [Phytophthora cinnamomi]
MSSPNASLPLPERTGGERVVLARFTTPSPGAMNAEQEVLARLRGYLLTEGSSWMPQTGISPHIGLFQQYAETCTALHQLLDVLLDEFVRALLGGSWIVRSQDSDREEASPQHSSSTTYYWPSDGRFHRMANDFKFPLGVWRLWWLGNPAADFPPFRTLHASDFAASNLKMSLERSVLVRYIRMTWKPKWGSYPSSFKPGGGGSSLSPRGGKRGAEAICPPETQGLKRAVTTLRRIQEAIHDANPDARSVPFRHIKRKKQQCS